MEAKLNFNQCTLPLLDKTFGVRNVVASAVLDDWLQEAATVELSDFEEQYCRTLQNLRFYHSTYSEGAQEHYY